MFQVLFCIDYCIDPLKHSSFSAGNKREVVVSHNSIADNSAGHSEEIVHAIRRGRLPKLKLS